MNDHFERRVRTAAVAGWWTLLFAVGMLLVSWAAYLGVLSTRPAWILSLWGPDLNWAFVQNVWFWGLAIFKVGIWLMALVILWLTIWARQLREAADRP